MLTQSKGKIYLSEQRGTLELDWFRSLHTFNFGKFQHEHKTPFGSLYVLNDETLGGGRSVRMDVEENSDIILLPVVGAISYKDGSGVSRLIEAGQVEWVRAPKGLTFEVANPYASELVRYLQIWLRNPDVWANPVPAQYGFDLDAQKNRLVEVFSASPSRLKGAFAPNGMQQPAKTPTVLIGKFNGREEAAYQMLNGGHGMFAFVIEGVFEVQYRLMQAGDGLGLWGVDEIVLEALSNDAIILMIEAPL